MATVYVVRDPKIGRSFKYDAPRTPCQVPSAGGATQLLSSVGARCKLPGAGSRVLAVRCVSVALDNGSCQVEDAPKAPHSADYNAEEIYR